MTVGALGAALASWMGGAGLSGCSLGRSPYPGYGDPCTTTNDCPEMSACATWTCSEANRCSLAIGPTALLNDPAGDCKKLTCDGDGAVLAAFDASDLPPDDDNPCTKEQCVEGGPFEVVLEGQACGTPASCASGMAKAADLCDAQGKCQIGAAKKCFPYACAGSTCKTKCTVAADCIPSYVCQMGACVPGDPLGDPCSGPETCGSGFCFDGVCCNDGDCGGKCRSCNQGGGKAGTCLPLPTGVTDLCPAGNVCNGSVSCVPLGSKLAVGEPCSANADCFNSFCYQGLCRLPDGAPCDAQSPWQCPTNLCKDGNCQTCSADADCSGGSCTAASRCLLLPSYTCGVPTDCVSGTCTGNVCK